MFFLIPTTVNEGAGKKALESYPVSYADLLGCREVLLALLPVFNLMIVMHALDPILAVQLLGLGVSKEWVGTAFTTIYISNLVSSPIAGKLSDKISFAWVQRTGCITTCISMFLIGPSKLLPASVRLMFTGFAVIGMSCSLVFLPAVP